MHQNNAEHSSLLLGAVRLPKQRRVVLANRVLSAFGISISDWQGSAFLLSTRTGKTEIIEDLGHLWPAAERLCARPCDPLAPDLIARLEGLVEVTSESSLWRLP